MADGDLQDVLLGASASLPSVGTLFWVVIVAAIGGTVVVLLIAAVILLVRQLCRGRRPASGRAGRRRHSRRAGAATSSAVSGRQRGGGGASGKAMSSVPLSACPSTEAETASSVYGWNDMEPSQGLGTIGLLASGSNGTSASLSAEAWPTLSQNGSPRLHRYGTEV